MERRSVQFFFGPGGQQAGAGICSLLRIRHKSLMTRVLTEGQNVSISCNIELPAEQETNRYLDTSLNFCYFVVRKTMLANEKIAEADMDSFCLSNDPEEICQTVVAAYQERLKYDSYDQSIR